ncbi:induced myeloid leukemia cell differentiation protein Mcl-1b [Tachysurus fulvidraco]|uniref:induced myeloid leukemia cell differentiation protein Mcl-1b n=1 Tax=Tachysurus fulvidraco TaxID=1234273 RepID=UPI000F504E0A|nr:induced myeloid leukemia cell differentiation protein Mcl-1b [Tachysurus fulvidraco]
MCVPFLKCGNLATMISSEDLPQTVSNVTSGYKEQKPVAVVRPTLNLGLSTENQRGLSDGSLPTSPEFDSDQVSGVGCFLEHNTQEIIEDFLQLITSPSRLCGRHNKVLKTMKRVVDNLLVKHDIVYKGMLVKLNLDKRGHDMSVISSVAKDLFSDGITNWGRIASLLAFGAVVARYEKESGRGDCVSLVAEELSSFLMHDQKEWLLKNNSWDGFEEFFHIPDAESSVRTALTTFVTVAGIGAVLAYMTR